MPERDFIAEFGSNEEKPKAPLERDFISEFSEKPEPAAQADDTQSPAIGGVTGLILDQHEKERGDTKYVGDFVQEYESRPKRAPAVKRSGEIGMRADRPRVTKTERGDISSVEKNIHPEYAEAFKAGRYDAWRVGPSGKYVPEPQQVVQETFLRENPDIKMDRKQLADLLGGMHPSRDSVKAMSGVRRVYAARAMQEYQRSVYAEDSGRTGIRDYPPGMLGPQEPITSPEEADAWMRANKEWLERDSGGTAIGVIVSGFISGVTGGVSEALRDMPPETRLRVESALQNSGALRIVSGGVETGGALLPIGRAVNVVAKGVKARLIAKGYTAEAAALRAKEIATPIGLGLYGGVAGGVRGGARGAAEGALGGIAFGTLAPAVSSYIRANWGLLPNYARHIVAEQIGFIAAGRAIGAAHSEPITMEAFLGDAIIGGIFGAVGGRSALSGRGPSRDLIDRGSRERSGLRAADMKAEEFREMRRGLESKLREADTREAVDAIDLAVREAKGAEAVEPQRRRVTDTEPSPTDSPAVAHLKRRAQRAKVVAEGRKQQAQEDPLTGLQTRRVIEKNRERVDKDPDNGWVEADMAGLSKVNAKRGEAFADKVLAEGGKKWRELADELGVRTGRRGGDEFIAWDGTPAKRAELARRFEAEGVTVDGETYRFRTGEAKTWDGLTDAMTAAKERVPTGREAPEAEAPRAEGKAEAVEGRKSSAEIAAEESARASRELIEGEGEGSPGLTEQPHSRGVTLVHRDKSGKPVAIIDANKKGVVDEIHSLPGNSGAVLKLISEANRRGWQIDPEPRGTDSPEGARLRSVLARRQKPAEAVRIEDVAKPTEGDAEGMVAPEYAAPYSHLDRPYTEPKPASKPVVTEGLDSPTKGRPDHVYRGMSNAEFQNTVGRVRRSQFGDYGEAEYAAEFATGGDMGQKGSGWLVEIRSVEMFNSLNYEMGWAKEAVGSGGVVTRAWKAEDIGGGRTRWTEVQLPEVGPELVRVEQPTTVKRGIGGKRTEVPNPNYPQREAPAEAVEPPKDTKAGERGAVTLPDLTSNHPRGLLRRTRNVADELQLKLSRQRNAEQMAADAVATRASRGLTKEQLEDVGAAIEGIGNVRTGKPVKESDLSPQQLRAKRQLERAYDKQRKRLNDYIYEATGGKTEEYFHFLEDYLPHFYKDGPKKLRAFATRWAKDSPHARQRKFPTLAEATKPVSEGGGGLTARTQNAAELYNLYSSATWATATTKAAIFRLRDMKMEDGNPALSGEKLEGYEYVTNELVNRMTYGGKGPKGEVRLFEKGAWVHPQAKGALEAMVGRPFAAKDGPLQSLFVGLETYNMVAKRMELSFSFFHDIALLESAWSTLGKWYNPVRGSVIIGERDPALGKRLPFTTPARAGKRVLELGVAEVKNKKGEVVQGRMTPEEFMRDATMHGLNLGTPSEVFRARYDRMRDSVVDALDKAHPGAGKAGGLWRWFSKAREKMLWGYHKKLKAMAYADATRHYLPKVKSAGDIPKLKKVVAKFVNDAFGGQEWDAGLLMRNPKFRQAMHGVIFAPDWTWSNLSVAMPRLGQQYKVPGTQLGPVNLRNRMWANYWKNMTISAAIMGHAAHHAIYQALGDPEKGDKPWPSRFFFPDVDFTPLVRAVKDVPLVSGLLAGPHKEGDPEEQRYVVHAQKQAREVLRGLTNTDQYLYSKSSALFRQVYGQITGTSGPGFEADFKREEKRTGRMQYGKRLAFWAKDFLPFAFRGGQVALALPAGKEISRYGATEKIAQALAGYAEPDLITFIGKGFRGQPYEKNLSAFAAETLEKAKRNGYDPKEILETSIKRVRAHYYRKVWEQLRDGRSAEDVDEEALRAVVRLNAGLGNLLDSMEARGYKVSPETRRALRDVLKRYGKEEGARRVTGSKPRPSLSPQDKRNLRKIGR